MHSLLPQSNAVAYAYFTQIRTHARFRTPKRRDLPIGGAVSRESCAMCRMLCPSWCIVQARVDGVEKEGGALLRIRKQGRRDRYSIVLSSVVLHNEHRKESTYTFGTIFNQRKKIYVMLLMMI